MRRRSQGTFNNNNNWCKKDMPESFHNNNKESKTTTTSTATTKIKTTTRKSLCKHKHKIFPKSKVRILYTQGHQLSQNSVITRRGDVMS